MSKAIQVLLDDQGRIVIPSAFRALLGLSQGMTLVVEKGEKDELCLRIQESPTLVDKQGVLVVRAESSIDLTNIVQHERHHRVSNLVQRAGL
jgi:AbrB family looped-hinge helix DNA binding protein